MKSGKYQLLWVLALSCAGLVLVASASARAASPSPAIAGEPSPSDGELRAQLESTDWHVRHDAAVILGWRRSPELYQALLALEPRLDRAGRLRFSGELLEQPGAGDILLERLLHGGESTALRVALVEALPIAGGDWSEAVVALLETAPEAELRRAIVSALPRAEASMALQGLRVAFRDADPGVRAEAARAAGWRSDASVVAPELRALLFDPDASTRMLAVRSLGWMRDGKSWQRLVHRLDDPSAEVRVEALHALGRIDPDRAGMLPEVRALVQDADPRVSRAASRMVPAR
jgi:HEAT repeat protein